MGEIYEPKDRQIGTLIAQGGLRIFFFFRNVYQQNLSFELRKKVFAKKIEKVIWSHWRWIPETCKQQGKGTKKHSNKTKPSRHS